MTQEHFYFAGAKEVNRNPVVEALIMNYENITVPNQKKKYEQLPLFVEI